MLDVLVLVSPKAILEMVTQRKMPKTSSKPAESFGEDLLVEVANLHDRGAERFWANWPFRKESSESLYEMRDELRQLWDPGMSDEDRSSILDQWVNYRHPGLRGIGYRHWRVSLQPPRILPDLKNLRGVLAFAVLLYLSQLAVCGNPGCPVKYFLGRRRDQKYCGGDCTNYAQRQYALKYWNREGKRRRAEKSKETRRTKKGE